MQRQVSGYSAFGKIDRKTNNGEDGELFIADPFATIGGKKSFQDLSFNSPKNTISGDLRLKSEKTGPLKAFKSEASFSNDQPLSCVITKPILTGELVLEDQ